MKQPLAKRYGINGTSIRKSLQLCYGTCVIVRGVEPSGVEPLPESFSGPRGADHNEPRLKAAPRGFSFLGPFLSSN
jgi:hypothetical protein